MFGFPLFFFQLIHTSLMGEMPFAMQLTGELSEAGLKNNRITTVIAL